MKENHVRIVLPKDLVSDLNKERKIETNSQGWFQLASVEEVKFTSVQIGPFKKENGQYYSNAVGLIKNSEHYGVYPGHWSGFPV